MKIEIVSKEKTKKIGKNNKPFDVLELRYKVGNKEYPRTIFSFGDGKPVYDVLMTNDSKFFEVTEDNSGKYPFWASAVPTTGDEVASTSNKSPKSTYETPEEREYRQVRIVRQSSIASAVSLLTLRGDKKVDELEVIRVAEVFVNYVQNGLAEAVANEFDNMQDEIPF